MLAIRKLARGIANVSVEEVPVPVAGPEEIVAEVDSAGICGTDLHIYLDEFETAPPVTLGHEFAGRIVELGKNVRGWQPGDRVTDVQAAVQDLFHAEAIGLVIECSGAGPAAETLLNLIRRGGRFCQMGLFGKSIPWNQDLVCYKDLSVTGTNAHVPSAWPYALKFMAEGRINVRRLITHRFPLDAWDQALQTAQTKQGVKILLKP
jgi:threonine dehydrogenase-like Zn-dependent dehydrogenase